MRSPAVLACASAAVLLAACRAEPAPEPAPPLTREAASAEELTASSPREEDAWARANPSYLAPTPPRLEGPPLDSLDVGRVAYPVPSDDDFVAHGEEVTLARNSTVGDDFGSARSTCELLVLRGWLRISCGSFLPSVSVLGGSTDGLYLATDEGTATITMALVPGDRRVLQLARGGGGYGESGLNRAAVISETWVGTTAPHVVISEPTFAQTF
jgi:hypothetical protein